MQDEQAHHSHSEEHILDELLSGDDSATHNADSAHPNGESGGIRPTSGRRSYYAYAGEDIPGGGTISSSDKPLRSITEEALAEAGVKPGILNRLRLNMNDASLDYEICRELAAEIAKHTTQNVIFKVDLASTRQRTQIMANFMEEHPQIVSRIQRSHAMFKKQLTEQLYALRDEAYTVRNQRVAEINRQARQHVKTPSEVKEEINVVQDILHHELNRLLDEYQRFALDTIQKFAHVTKPLPKGRGFPLHEEHTHART